MEWKEGGIVTITDVRVRLLETKDDRLKAFCSITFDDEFVVKDIKIIQGAKGVFVAMPSRKLADKCPKCSTKNHLRARFCGQCGKRLPERQIPLDEENRPKLHADIAHPISLKCREELQARILAAFQAEVENSKKPGYRPVNIYSPDELDVDDRTGAEQPPPPEPPRADQPRREFGSGIL
jgi:stage V sporulation protein G